MAGTALPGRLTSRLVWRTATLVTAHAETPDARTLIFRTPGWPGHLAGQRVDIRLTAADGYTAQRAYSMSAPVDDERVTVTVQRVADGELSPYLVDQLADGDAVEIRGPVGGWFVWPDADSADRPVLLIGGGSGVVPLMAMIRARRAARSRVPFRLIYSVRTPGDLFFGSELRRPPAADGGLDTTVVYTRELPDGLAGRPRRLTRSQLVADGWPPDLRPTCYVCGPTAFVEFVASELVDLGHRPELIRTERFGPSSD